MIKTDELCLLYALFSILNIEAGLFGEEEATSYSRLTRIFPQCRIIYAPNFGNISLNVSPLLKANLAMGTLIKH